MGARHLQFRVRSDLGVFGSPSLSSSKLSPQGPLAVVVVVVIEREREKEKERERPGTIDYDDDYDNDSDIWV